MGAHVNIGSVLVERLDKQINDHIQDMTCSNVANIYFGIVQAISNLGGNPDNLTGLTEFILYRVIHHLNVDKIENGDIFIQTKGKIGLRNPDLIIWKSDKPIYSVQVKSNYYKVKEDYDRHMEVKETCPSASIATIAFEVKDPNHIKQIKKYEQLNSDYKCLILKDNHMPIRDAIYQLGLIFQ